MKIKVLPPDINQSNANWTPVKDPNVQFTDNHIGFIRYGLASIAGVSSETVDEIISKRPFDSVEAMVFLTNGTKVNKTKVVNLIKTGCFDSINKNRNLLLRNYLQQKGDKEYEQIPVTINKKHILDYEKELLGMSVTLKSRWDEIPDGKEGISQTGIVFQYKEERSKKGNLYANMWISTQEDVRKVVIFARQLEKLQGQLRENIKVQVVGKKSKDDLVADRITIMSKDVDQSQWEVDIA
jgi:DNA polymerase-3 subunit alpha